ncbi:aminotransferase class I/II-fold pyridoxal phosphate-dependent enzyme, partial [Micrococcus aloeverae]|uniref:aminotransferase class I/II-fold pyridoxal phosphate-dependent enzyme n=2 Tax=Micrococcales TaxID=85006 RepID=UPI000AC51E7F
GAGRCAVLDSATSAVITGEARDLVNFASCSFLNMHNHPDVLETFVTQAPRFGLATGGSRMIQGKLRPHVELEEALAEATGKEAVITFASGLLANVGFVHAMSRSMTIGGDLSWNVDDIVFLLDHDSHWSMWKAVEGLKFGERVLAFKHNDLDSLERRLQGLNGRRAVIMFESIYSDDGSIAPVRGIVDLARKYDALTFVDDANGFLVYGPERFRFAEEFAALKDVTFHMVSLSKAVGLEGGAIAGPAEYIAVFEWLAGTSSFTATMLPPQAAAAVRAMALIRDDSSILDRFHSIVDHFRAALSEAGFELNPTPAYITTTRIGAESDAEQVRERAHDAGYLVPVFRYPAVKRGRAGLRLMPNIDHTEEHIAGFAATLRGIRDAVGF